MTKLEVFDPPMCCSSGVCGPNVTTDLTRFAATLKWFAGQGVTVIRHNLAREPLAFAENDAVKTAMRADDTCLPLVLVDGKIVSRSAYPTPGELAASICVAMLARKENPRDKAPALAALAGRHTQEDISRKTNRSPCCGPRSGGRKGPTCCS